MCTTVPRVRGCDLDPVRGLPYRPAAVRCRARGRTDGSIRPRATTVLKFPLARKGASTDVARIGGAGAMTPDPVLGSCDADGLRASQLQHAIEHVDRHVHLGRLTLVRVRAQP